MVAEHAMVSGGGAPSLGKIRRMFDAADINGDGRVDFNEFVLMRTRKLKREHKKGRRREREERRRARARGADESEESEGADADQWPTPAKAEAPWVGKLRRAKEAEEEEAVARMRESVARELVRYDEKRSVADLGGIDDDELRKHLGWHE